MALYKRLTGFNKTNMIFEFSTSKIVLDQLKIPRHQICCRPVIYIYINGKPKHVKSHVALYTKVNLIEQNQRDFLIQHIKIVLDQLKKNLGTKFVVVQCNFQ